MTTMENVLVGIYNFNFPTNIVTLGIEKIQKFQHQKNLLSPKVKHGLIQKMGK